jgi:hypothetical protein
VSLRSEDKCGFRVCKGNSCFCGKLHAQLLGGSIFFT